jgi:hypothetical protein
MNDLGEHENIDALIQRFFAAFDNRNARIPRQELITELFAERAIIATHHDGRCELYSPSEFAEPRIALLRSGDLLEFHEWEETSSTQIVGELATRTSRYAKAGLHLGAEYAGRGTKFFQLAKFSSGWRIVALSWIDDPA